MPDRLNIKPIAHIHTDFPSKFGVPRQSGLVNELTAEIVFTPPYRDKNALRGIEEFSHLWLIWHFSYFSGNSAWSPTVRPPRLGGNKRMGVFATRSPNRPNPIGLSSVKLLGVEPDSKSGPIIYVSGADLVDGTPIFDIKPYLPFTDSHPDATGGFSEEVMDYSLDVIIDEKLLSQLPNDKTAPLIKILKQDPRPAYQHDPNRIYKFDFSESTISFYVANGVLTVTDIKPKDKI